LTKVGQKPFVVFESLCSSSGCYSAFAFCPIFTVMVKHCCYGTCKSDSRRRDTSIVFFPFPKPKTRLEDCLRWIKACGRPHCGFNVNKITKDTYICSKVSDEIVFSKSVNNSPVVMLCYACYVILKTVSLICVLLLFY